MFFFLMIRRPPRSTLDRSSAASDVYKRQEEEELAFDVGNGFGEAKDESGVIGGFDGVEVASVCLLYTSPSPRDRTRSRMPSSA
mgnify:CR=1 FL=1